MARIIGKKYEFHKPSLENECLSIIRETNRRCRKLDTHGRTLLPEVFNKVFQESRFGKIIAKKDVPNYDPSEMCKLQEIENFLYPPFIQKDNT